MADRIVLHFKHTRVYLNTNVNEVGANISTTLRTVESHNDSDTKYVRMYGEDYKVRSISDVSLNALHPGFVIRYDFYSQDTNTHFGYWESNGFVQSFTQDETIPGGSPAENIKMVFDYTVNSSCRSFSGDIITLTTDVDGGGYPFVLGTETISNISNPLSRTYQYFYFARSGSSYYGATRKHGGYRHTPDGTERKPYFDIESAYTAMKSAGWHKVVILDSETYNEDLDFDDASSYIFSALGQTPKIGIEIGASEENKASQVYNNNTATYFNDAGNDSSGWGSFHEPYKTLSQASGGSLACVLGGENYTGTAFANATQSIGAIMPGNVEADDGYILTCTGYMLIDRTKRIQNVSITGYITLGNGGSGGTPTMQNCTVNGYVDSSFANNSTFLYTKVTGTGIKINLTNGSTTTVSYCILYNCSYGIGFGSSGSAVAITVDITNTVIYGATTAISWDNLQANTVTVTLTAENLTLFNNTKGINISQFCAIASGTFDNIIFNNCTTCIDTDINLTTNYCNFYTYTTKTAGSGVVTINNEISGDPKLCRIDEAPYFWGLSFDSVCIKADGSENDIGALMGNAKISANNININGIIFDGFNSFNTGIYKTGSSDYTGLIVKWCTIKNYNGMPIDDYAGVQTGSQIINCGIYDNGGGVKLTYGGNDITECLFYNNITFNLYTDYADHDITHCTFHGAFYNIYVDSNASSVDILDSIFHGATSATGVYSEISIQLNYCCITDGRSSDVDISPATNKIDNPNFVNVDIGFEDYHLKTKEGWNGITYNFDSVCKDSASDGYDIGCYLLTRSVDEDTWNSYQLEFDPDSMNRQNLPKGQIKSEYAQGGISLNAKSHKKVLPMIWNDDTYMSEDQYDILEYISTLIKTEENGISREETKIRASLLPDTYIQAGSSAVIDATNKTITDSSKEWRFNKFKGWWVNILYGLGDNTGTIDADAKTLQVSGASWDTDEWIGYYFYHPTQYHFYYIKSNTSDTLTLSDSNGDLVDAINIDWQIIRSFRIASNTKTVLNLEDPDSELVAGINNYIIDFMETKIQDSVFMGKQYFDYDFDRKIDMTGIALILEES